MEMKARDIKPFGLRMNEVKKGKVKDEATRNRHSMNVEIDLLIEDGFRWREMQEEKQAVA